MGILHIKIKIFCNFFKKGVDNVTISNYNIIAVKDMIQNVASVLRLPWRQAKDKTESSMAKSVVQIVTTEVDSTKGNLCSAKGIIGLGGSRK